MSYVFDKSMADLTVPAPALSELIDDGTRPPALSPSVSLVDAPVGHPLREPADKLVYEVYRTAGYCDESPDEVVAELRRFEPLSVYHLAVADGEVVGSLRTVLADITELQIGSFDLHDDTMMGRMCEFSALAMSPSFRGTGVVEHLYRAAWLAAVRASVPALVAVVDPWLLEVLRDGIGLPFEQVGAPRSYLGGDEVLPVALSLDPKAYTGLAASHAGFWQWTLGGFTDAELAEFAFPPPVVK